jgi:hypothetical protein
MLRRIKFSGVRNFAPSTLVTIKCDQKPVIILEKGNESHSVALECLRWAILGKFPSESEEERAFFNPSNFGLRDFIATVIITFSTHYSAILTVQRSFFIFRIGTELLRKKWQDYLIRYNDNAFNNYEELIVHNLDVQVPEFFGLSPEFLDKVCLCHQVC